MLLGFNSTPPNGNEVKFYFLTMDTMGKKS